MGYFKNLWNAITGKTDKVQADAVNAAVESTTSKLNEEYETIQMKHQKEHQKELDAVQKEAFQEGIEYGHDALIADRKLQKKSELHKQMAIHDNEEKREKQSRRRAEDFEEALEEVLKITRKREEEDPLHQDKDFNEDLDKKFSEIQKRIQKNITEGRNEGSFYLNTGYSYGAHMSPLEHFMGYAFEDIHIPTSRKSSKYAQELLKMLLENGADPMLVVCNNGLYPPLFSALELTRVSYDSKILDIMTGYLSDEDIKALPAMVKEYEENHGGRVPEDSFILAASLKTHGINVDAFHPEDPKELNDWIERHEEDDSNYSKRREKSDEKMRALLAARSGKAKQVTASACRARKQPTQ